MPQVDRRYINGFLEIHNLNDIDPILVSMRMIKSQEELQLARHAGEVASSMMVAGRNSIEDGIPEFEVALAAIKNVTKY